MCGASAVAPAAGGQLLDALPPVIHLRGSECLAPEWLVGLIRMIATEMAASGPGSEAVVTRLTDALLAQAIRHSLVEIDRTLDQSAAFSDPQIAKALRLMRDRPDHSWTVPEMAAAVAMSRSTFAERFRVAMGETPMQHLTRFRMARAAAGRRGCSSRPSCRTGIHPASPWSRRSGSSRPRWSCPTRSSRPAPASPCFRPRFRTQACLLLPSNFQACARIITQDDERLPRGST